MEVSPTRLEGMETLSRILGVPLSDLYVSDPP